MELVEQFVDLMGAALVQLSVKQGIEAFGDDGVQAVPKELQQLRDRAATKPKFANELTREDKPAALQHLMHLNGSDVARLKAVVVPMDGSNVSTPRKRP